MRNLLITCAVAFGFIACEKSAGEGGTSVIEGQVYKSFIWNDDQTGMSDTLYFEVDVGKDVFIIYSNNEENVYDDKFETDHNGRYRFEFLRKGDYTIYTYADSTEQITPVINLKYPYPLYKKVTIFSNNSTNKVDNFIVEKNQ